MKEKTIGIVGGVGPHAGLYVLAKLLEETEAYTDQDHLPVVLFSMPGHIADRTAFLSGKSDRNPADGLYEVIRKMEDAGIEVAGIACNTAHAPRIFHPLLDKLEQGRCTVKLLNIVEETVSFIRNAYPHIGKVGVLSTAATEAEGVYTTALLARGLTPVLLPPGLSGMVNACIYDPDYGIKARPLPIEERVHRELNAASGHLADHGAEAIILGCTELPLALPGSGRGETAWIDSSLALARALIREAAPEKLKVCGEIKQRTV